MPRNTYLVCYDICDDKRLKTVYKTMRDFGDHLQYSIAAPLKRARARCSHHRSRRLSATNWSWPH